jgi:hypothetical protein
MSILETIAIKLNKERLNKKLTQEYLADKAGFYTN